MTPPQRPAPVRDTKSSLYEAAVAAVKDREVAAARAPRAAPPRQRGRTMRVALLLVLVGVLLLVLRPAWLAGPKAPPPESPGVAAASLRLTLLRERQRVFKFAKEQGRLPSGLIEVGGGQPGIEYSTSGPDAFRLTGRAGDSVITLQSGDSMAAFLGNSLRRLKDRGQP